MRTETSRSGSTTAATNPTSALETIFVLSQVRRSLKLGHNLFIFQNGNINRLSLCIN
jgi:hypothetical protein